MTEYRKKSRLKIIKFSWIIYTSLCPSLTRKHARPMLWLENNLFWHSSLSLFPILDVFIRKTSIQHAVYRLLHIQYIFITHTNKVWLEIEWRVNRLDSIEISKLTIFTYNTRKLNDIDFSNEPWNNRRIDNQQRTWMHRGETKDSHKGTKADNCEQQFIHVHATFWISFH